MRCVLISFPACQAKLGQNAALQLRDRNFFSIGEAEPAQGTAAIMAGVFLVSAAQILRQEESREVTARAL
jgi:hypothetical protein